MRNFFVMGAVFLVISLFAGCAMNSKTVINYPRESFTCMNGTILKVDDVHEDTSFHGPTSEPEVVKNAVLTLQADNLQLFTADYKMVYDVKATSTTFQYRLDCSVASVGKRVAIYFEGKDKVIGIDSTPNPYLEKMHHKK